MKKSFIENFNYYRARLRGILYNLLPNITVGKYTLIEPGATLSCQYEGSIKIGDSCIVYRNGMLVTHGGDIVIGNHVTINPFAVIYGQGGVKIDDGVRIASHCTVVPSNHIFNDPDTFIYKQGLSKKGISIEKDVWLGSGVKVLDGVVIGKGCVIGANSVVTKSTDPFGVYVGVPATKIKSRITK